MYQTVGHDAVHLVAEALQLPLYRHVITGQPLQTGSSFGVQDGQSRSRDETEDLYELLVAVKRHHPDIEAVSVGAILSNYQRTRVETICARPELNLQVLAYLWQRDQSELLNEMVQADVRAVLIKVAGIGLDERDLGKSLAQMQPKLTKLNNLYGAHVCGEGGEYETLTLDCPLFKKRIQLDETEIVVDTDSGNVASVAYLRMTRASLVDKEGQQSSTLENVLVPPVLDTLGRRSLAAVQSAIAESSASGATSTSFVLPKLQPSSASKPGCRCRAKGKWVAFHDITADDSSLNSTEEAVQSAFVNLKSEWRGVSKRQMYKLKSHIFFSTLLVLDELSKHNLSLAHCQHINLCIQSQSDFKSINAIYQRQFSIEPPSRATVALPRQSTPIKLDGWAYDDGSRYDASSTSIQLTPGSRSHERQALHVQGLSYWASANIGPYSQAVLAASRMTIAGQIGLVPRDLSLPENEHVQYALSLQHARRIFDAVLNERSRGEKGWIEGGICWVASEDKVRGAKACWDGQCHNDEDDDDEDEAGPNWLFGSEGISHGASTSTQTPPRGRNPLPMLYAQVAEDALPRSAIVEWQLTGHDGRRRSSTSQPGDDDEDEDESTEATRPEVRNGEYVCLSSLYCPVSCTSL